MDIASFRCSMKTMPSYSKSLWVTALAAGFAIACNRSSISVPRPGSTGGASSSGGSVSGGVGGTAGANTAATGGTSGAGTSGTGTGGTGGTGGPPSDATALAVCSDLPAPPAIDSCVQPAGGWGTVPPGSGSLSAKFGGTITAVTQGPVAGGCLQPGSNATSEVVVLSVHADTDASAAEWDVEYQVPTNITTWKVGEHIDVAYALNGGGWSPTVSSLTLNFGQAVDVYIGTGGQAADLSDVPLTFRQGSAICLEHDTCGDWSGYALEVKVANGWVQVPYGGTTGVGGYMGIHGGMAEQLTSSSSCMDWYVSRVRVAVLRSVN